MSEAIKPRVRMPAKAQPGEMIEVKTLISHPMESGQRRDSAGNLVPRKIINRFTATFNGRTVFDASLEPAISANPYIAFFVKATETGKFEFSWTDDDGTVFKTEQALTVG
jgi:sulfur-oxidizing protein SoxZ